MLSLLHLVLEPVAGGQLLGVSKQGQNNTTARAGSEEVLPPCGLRRACGCEPALKTQQGIDDVRWVAAAARMPDGTSDLRHMDER
jgi:hypothetical protein